MQGEKAEQPENQETTPLDKVRKEVKEMEGDSGGVEVFLIDKGLDIFKRLLPRKDLLVIGGSKSWCRPQRGFMCLQSTSQPLLSPRKDLLVRGGSKSWCCPLRERLREEAWDVLYKHMEPGRGTHVIELYTNLKDRKNLTCYVRGRWVPFGERAISQW